MIQFDDLVQASRRRDAQFVLAHADEVLLQAACPAEKVGWVFYHKCNAALDVDNNVLAIAAGEQALTWAEQHHDVELEGLVRVLLGYTLNHMGRVAEAAGVLEGYLARLPNHPEWQRREDIARYNLGVAYRHSGRLAAAVEQYRGALSLPESRPGLHVQIRQNLAWALILLGDAAGAREQLEAVAENVRETLSLSRLTSFWVDQAALHLIEGETAAARSACQQVLNALDEKQRGAHLATTYITLAQIALAEGKPEEAQRCCTQARIHAERAERWDLHNEATRIWVTILEKGGTACEETRSVTAARLLVISRGGRQRNGD